MAYLFNRSCFSFRVIPSVALIFDLGVHPGCKINVFHSVDFQTTHIRIPRELVINTASWAPPQTAWIKISWEWGSGMYLFYKLPNNTYVHSKLKLKGLGQWVSTGASSARTPLPQGYLAGSGDIVAAVTQRGALVASSRWRLGMLLDILQCAGRPHHKEWSGSKCQ